MIRKLEFDEIDKIEHLATLFSKSSKHVNVNMEVFKASWSNYIQNCFGDIFIAEADGKIIGMIGGIKYPDPCNGVLMATEMFWIVDTDYRGKKCGLSLLRRFEEWAKENECKKIIMVHMSDLMPERVKKLYGLLKYEELETNYIKEL